jgi:hypothetical protein
MSASVATPFVNRPTALPPVCEIDSPRAQRMR